MSKDDTVAPRSGFLCTYMSNHPDTLVAYVRHQGKVSERVASARMTSINQKEMTLAYKLPKSTNEKIVTIGFDPPLFGYDEVKPRLLSMKLDAEESLGMMPRPQLTPFHFPMKALTTTFGPMLALIYVTYDLSGAGWIRKLVGGDTTLYWIWVFMLSTHALESLYTAHLCRKHRTGLFDGFLYILCTLIFGFPIWQNMRQRIQRIRIESIEKVH